MEYKFVQTTQGPVIVGDDEVLFFSQFGPLVDYVDADPEFLTKAKVYVADGLMAVAADVANSLSMAVVGGDLTSTLYGYVNALNQIKQFEFGYLPSVSKS